MLRIEITFNFVSLLEFTRPLIVIHRDRSRRGPCPKSTRQMFPHLKKNKSLDRNFAIQLLTEAVRMASPEKTKQVPEKEIN